MLVSLPLVLVALAQQPADVVHWTAATQTTTVEAGQTVTIRLTADIEPGWHLYALTQPAIGPRRLEIKTVKGSRFSIVTARISGPLPKVERDPNFGVDAHYYDEKTTIDVPVAIPQKSPAGKQAVALEVGYQVCSGRLCLRPATETVHADLMVVKERR
jgi:Thiol:disulfide interchange protein DsbD, N-terminal